MHLRLFNFVVLPPSFCCFKIITTAFIVSETMLTGYLLNISFPHVDRTLSAQASRVGGFSSLQGTNSPRPGHAMDDFKLHLDIMMISLNSCVAWTPEYSNFTTNILSFFQLLVFFFPERLEFYSSKSWQTPKIRFSVQIGPWSNNPWICSFLPCEAQTKA